MNAAVEQEKCAAVGAFNRRSRTRIFVAWEHARFAFSVKIFLTEKEK
jgi:hypothetical protein